MLKRRKILLNSKISCKTEDSRISFMNTSIERSMGSISIISKTGVLSHLRRLSHPLPFAFMCCFFTPFPFFLKLGLLHEVFKRSQLVYVLNTVWPQCYQNKKLLKISRRHVILTHHPDHGSWLRPLVLRFFTRRLTIVVCVVFTCSTVLFSLLVNDQVDVKYDVD